MHDADHQHTAEALDRDIAVPLPLDERAAEDVRQWVAENIGVSDE